MQKQLIVLTNKQWQGIFIDASILANRGWEPSGGITQANPTNLDPDGLYLLVMTRSEESRLEYENSDRYIKDT